ncbi:MAG: GspE/PulE family protein, partial [Candidatus Pacebacteria bacterium]|nr:GspE/PulE family protein [Candidatus Paceibacterota bacterium]
MPVSEKTYHALFVESKMVSEDDYARARDEGKADNHSLEGALVELGVLKNEEVSKVMAEAYGVESINLLDFKIDPEALKLLPDVVVRKRFVLPYAFNGRRLKVAMVDPGNVELLDFITKRTGLSLDVGYVTPDIFEDAIRSYSEDTVARIQSISELFEKIHRDHPEGKASGGEEEHVIEMVDLLLQYGYGNGASDVHIEPKENMSLVRYRIDGVLHDVVKLSSVFGKLIIARIKIMAMLRTDEHLAAQDGKFRLHIGNKTVDVRVSILPVVEGEKVVLRILSEKGHIFTLDTLGFSPEDLKRVRSAALKPHGMILSTGPTGSGKTTSMYAILKLLNKREVNIQTIEDPVEYELDGVNQIQVNILTNLTFANGLRSIVRQDPDIIMVGEIRDAETASISVNAAMTGHLLLSTLHTNDAATAFPRLLDLGVEPFLIASSVNLLIAQRLVRQNCGHCTRSSVEDIVKLKEAIPESLYKKYFGEKENFKLFRGKGCSFCSQTGFAGRLGIFEVIEVTEAIRSLVMQRVNADVINQKAIQEGMTTMF